MTMGFDELVEIMHRLRQGCPWDRKQTRESLKPFLLEECYEVLESLEEDAPKKIREELGDLLFQILFHAEIGRERGEFDIGGVIEGISEKMISRHPHVFEEGRELETAEEVVDQWDRVKKAEGKLKESVLEGVPNAMPSLLRAHRLQARAAKVGFDWDEIGDVLDKVDEELKEFRAALSAKEQSAIEDELGDIFFALVNVSRFVGVNPEDALRRTISKFISRFRHIEMRAGEQGRELSDMTLSEMDALWDEAKKKE